MVARPPELPPTFATFFGTVHKKRRTEHSAGSDSDSAGEGFFRSRSLPASFPPSADSTGPMIITGLRPRTHIDTILRETPERRPFTSPTHTPHLVREDRPQPPSFMPTATKKTLEPCEEENTLVSRGDSESAEVFAIDINAPHLEKRRSAHRLHSVPPSPLRPFVRAVFLASEIPFLILMTYAIYWIEVCYLAAHRAPTTVWLNAMVAGILVGIGLNANAYRALYRPMSRERKFQAEKRKGIHSGRYVENVSPVSYGGGGGGGGLSTRSLRIYAFMSSAAMPVTWSEQDKEFDLGMMIRFFIIPFAVSSLSGITNNAREEFILVFPRDRPTLITFILIPSLIVATLVAMRLYFILTIPLKPFWKAMFLNGKLLL